MKLSVLNHIKNPSHIFNFCHCTGNINLPLDIGASHVLQL